MMLACVLLSEIAMISEHLQIFYAVIKCYLRGLRNNDNERNISQVHQRKCIKGKKETNITS